MSTGMEQLRSAACLLSALGLSACSSPASEDPVALRDGLYTFKATGLAGKRASAEDVCLSGGDDAGKIDTLITGQFALTEDCSHQPDARVGNAVAGNLTCEIDDSTGVKSAYKGSVTAESLALDVTVRSYGPGEETSAYGSFLAQRSGDC